MIAELPFDACCVIRGFDCLRDFVSIFCLFDVTVLDQKLPDVCGQFLCSVAMSIVTQLFMFSGDDLLHNTLQQELKEPTAFSGYDDFGPKILHKFRQHDVFKKYDESCA